MRVYEAAINHFRHNIILSSREFPGDEYNMFVKFQLIRFNPFITFIPFRTSFKKPSGKNTIFPKLQSLCLGAIKLQCDTTKFCQLRTFINGVSMVFSNN